MENKAVSRKSAFQELKALIVVCSIALTVLIGVAVARYASLPDYDVVKVDERLSAAE